jgi:UDP-3-O-[3-hydroxymyristoyl] glucosamine N-acyltransferase
MEMARMTVKELAERIGAQVAGAGGAATVSSVNTLQDAQPGQVSFLSNPKYAAQLAETKASAVIVAKQVDAEGVTLLKTGEPYYALAQAVVALHGHRKHPHTGVHPQAHVDPTATVGEETVIYPGVYVGPGVKIGRACILYPNVAIYEGCVLGDRVIAHAGAVIGQDGFGYATRQGVHHKIPQVGNVVIEDDVEIGANTCIARAALGSTTIGRGTKIDAQVMIGHNAKIGPQGMIVAQVGVAGSTTIGRQVTLAGQVGVAGHLKLGDNVTIGAQSGVFTDVADQSTLVGAPAMPAMQARRVYAVFTELPELLQRIKHLEQQIAELSSDAG